MHLRGYPTYVGLDGYAADQLSNLSAIDELVSYSCL